MKSALFALFGCVVSTVLFLCAKADPDADVVDGRQPQEAPPTESPSTPLGEPQVVLGTACGRKTAQEAIRAVAKAFAERTGMRPSFETGLVSRDGNEGQALCTFRNGAQRVKSLIVCDLKEDLTVLAFDREGTFTRNYPDLLRKVRERIGQESPRHRPWTLKTRTLSDGSSMDIPGSWRLQGNRGMMSAEGPEGSVDYGCATQVFSTRHRNQVGRAPRGVLFADYRSPSQVHRDLFPQIATLLQESGYPATRFVGINESAPVPNRVGPSEVIDSEWDRVRDGDTVRWRSLSLVVIVRMGDSLMYYTSAVHAPAASFPSELRNLLRIWNSAAVSVATQEGRLDQAAESLRAVSRMLVDANTARTAAFERSHKAWDAYFRAEDIVRDHETGRTVRGSTGGGGDIRRVLDAANQGAGYQRFQLLDPKEVD